MYSAVFLEVALPLTIAALVVLAAWAQFHRQNCALRKSVRALEFAEAKYRRIFENAIEGIFQTSVDGAYLEANPALARIYGYESPAALREGICNISQQLYVDPLRRDEFIRIMREQRWVTGFESQIRRRDGSVAWIRENAREVRTSDGELVCYEGTVEDVTEHKQAQMLQRERDAAELASRAKSEFLANMSHELRTPLNGVSGMLDLLSGTPMPAEQRRYVDIARSSAEMLLTVINQVLDYSKIEAGNLDLEVINFNLRDVLEDTAESLSHRAEKRGLELVLAVPDGIPTALRGDPNRLCQILLNLASNAIKFTEQGHVIVRVSTELQTESEAIVRFSVEDTGIGIPPERLSRLFRSFSQVDASTTRRFGGTGLGLAISKRLVELMRGEIGVESTPGKGSTFWFTATFELQPAGTRQNLPIPQALAATRVLVVDDNAVNREILSQQLAAWKIPAQVVSSAAAALETLRDSASDGTPYSLAILDVHMPEMDGLQLAREIRKDVRFASTKLILLTSIGNPLKPAEMVSLGVVSCLTKPARQHHLFDAIVGTASRQRSSPSPVEPTKQPASSKGTRGRLLLAEDNDVNQIVASEIVRRAGYSCDIVENGLKALEALEKSSYDLVLMDCHMPELDGLQATRLIRKREQSGGVPHQQRPLPIIALTASAVAGDRERFLQAGMNEYISKPFNPLQLIEKIESLLGNSLLGNADSAAGRERAASEEQVPCPQMPPIDRQVLAGRCMDDQVLALQVLQRFSARADQTLEELSESVTSCDSPRTVMRAHTLKGAAASLAADPLSKLAARLEEAGRNGAWEDAADVLVQLRRESARCTEFIKRLPQERDVATSAS
jgi:PAS domain S-box-containing protein